MHQPGYVQGGQEVGRDYLLLGIHYRRIRSTHNRAVFGKIKMDPAKGAQTQNAGEVSLLQWFFSQSIELMTDKVWLHCIIPMLLK
jgi:hypothetical protein